MVTYHFTFHAYRTWNADRPQGFVLRGKGIQPPNPTLARKYDKRASQPMTVFLERHQRTLIWLAWDACERRNWRLHQIATDPTHVHLLVSFSSSGQKFQPWEQVRAKLKNLMSWALSKAFQEKGRKWFVRSASRKRVENQKHFDYLMNVYLPNHRGLSWKEGDEPPEPPSELLTETEPEIPTEPAANAASTPSCERKPQ